MRGDRSVTWRSLPYPFLRGLSSASGAVTQPRICPAPTPGGPWNVPWVGIRRLCPLQLAVEWRWGLRQDHARGAAVDFVDPVEASREHARLIAITRAWWRLKHPKLYKNSEPLDREAKHHLEHARYLVESGQGPPQLWEPEPRG